MTKKETDKLKAQVKAAKKAADSTLADAIKTIALEQKIATYSSPMYARRALTKLDNTKLDAITTMIADQYAQNDRKMSLVFGMGLLPNKILAILKSIQYSKHEEKLDLLLMTGLSEDIIEETLDAYGNTSFFSKAAIEVVPAQPMDIMKIKILLTEVARDMGLVSNLDLSRFNSENVKYQYDRAQLRADEMLANTQEYVEQATTYSE